jgi:hypothetical protein
MPICIPKEPSGKSSTRNELSALESGGFFKNTLFCSTVVFFSASFTLS